MNKSYIPEIIEKITPLYNYYKREKTSISGTNAIAIMWEIGQILNFYIEKYTLKPHNLYREIYGKSEGKTNISQNSYITREFLGRCYRINNIFPQKSLIEQTFPNLKSFTVFREAMPFFDNQTYKLSKTEKQKLLNLLNSNKESKLLIKQLDVWKKSINNVQNPRTQKLSNYDKHKTNFIDFYNLIYAAIKLKNYEIVFDYIGIKDFSQCNLIINNLYVLIKDNIRSELIEIKDYSNKITINFVEILNELISGGNAIERRRFRRIIPPEVILKLIDMLLSLKSKNSYDLFL